VYIPTPLPQKLLFLGRGVEESFIVISDYEINPSVLAATSPIFRCAKHPAYGARQRRRFKISSQ